MPHLFSWLPLSAFASEFPNGMLPEELKQIVEHSKIDPALSTCIHLNLVVGNANVLNHRERQLIALQHLLLMPETRSLAEKYIKEDPSPFVLSRRHLLELLKWIAVYSGSAQAGDKEIPDCFLKAATGAAELAAKRHDPVLEPRKDDKPEERIRKALPAVREIALYADPGWFPLHSLGRAKVLLEDGLFTNEKFANEFLKRTGLTLQEFLTCMAGIACLGLGAKRPETGTRQYVFTLNNLIAQDAQLKAIFEKFFASFATSPEQIRKALSGKDPADFYDFKLLRQRPIVSFSDGAFLIVDPIFFSQCLAVGPMFRILGIGENEVFGAFGIAFENYVGSLFETYSQRFLAGSGGYISRNRKIHSGRGKERELSDIAISFDDSVALIETKGAWLKDTILADLDADKFLSELHSKYGITDGTERDKGFAQIADSIVSLAEGGAIATNQDGPNDGDKVFSDKVNTIYPVLIVHDPLIHATGFIGHILAVEFARRLGQGDASDTGFFEFAGTKRTFKIAYLTVATIDDIERLFAISGSSKNFLEHIQAFSEMDPFRLALTFDRYVAGQGTCDPLLSPLVANSQELLKRAGQTLAPG